MFQEEHIPLWAKILALPCYICPLCVIARIRPNSSFAKNFKKVQRHCPCCKAMEKIKHIKIAAQQESEQSVAVKQDSKQQVPADSQT